MLEKYLRSTEHIDWKDAQVSGLAMELGARGKTDVEVSHRCFEWVRSNIKHCGFHRINVVTSSASDVLAKKTGNCYGKSHLLAALLRANRIPAGICYQRLSKKGEGEPYCLHGMNAVFLREYGWYRIDPRGKDEGIVPIFSPPLEYFPLNDENEKNFPEIFDNPLPSVVRSLEESLTYWELYQNLPDVAQVPKVSDGGAWSQLEGAS